MNSELLKASQFETVTQNCTQNLGRQSSPEPPSASQSHFAPKTTIWCGTSLKKSKKHCTGAPPESPSTVKHMLFEPFGIHPRIHPIHRIHRIQRNPSDPPDQVSAAPAQTLPNTRAGGQDDVSSNKLPQMRNGT